MDQIQQVVNQPSDPAASREAQPQVQLPDAPVVAPVPAPQPGDKTDSALLLKSLQEERAKRKELEEENQRLRTTTPISSELEYSDEGLLLKKQLDDQGAKLAQLEDERNLERTYNQFPSLKGLESEFEAYRADYPRHKLENVAKLFLAEKGMLEPQRKGLETPTGGSRTPAPTGELTPEENRDLRTKDHRKYKEMLMKDQIKIKST